MKAMSTMSTRIAGIRGLAVVLGLLVLLAAACTDKGEGVAGADGDATASGSGEGDGQGDLEEMLAFAECMRENGVPDMPDPVQDDEGGVSIDLPEGVSPDDEEFQAAEKACEDLMPVPGDGEALDPETYTALVEFSDCMRTNGVENYPDPEPNGGMKFEDLDTESDAFKAAAETCADLFPEGYGEEDSGDDE